MGLVYAGGTKKGNIREGEDKKEESPIYQLSASPQNQNSVRGRSNQLPSASRSGESSTQRSRKRRN
jgi:hypothetical protein